MCRAAYRSSSGALTVLADSGLYTHVVTGHCPGWVGTHPLPPNLDKGRSTHGYISQRLQIEFEAPDDERCAPRNMLSLQ